MKTQPPTHSPNRESSKIEQDFKYFNWRLQILAKLNFNSNCAKLSLNSTQSQLKLLSLALLSSSLFFSLSFLKYVHFSYSPVCFSILNGPYTRPPVRLSKFELSWCWAWSHYFLGGWLYQLEIRLTKPKLKLKLTWNKSKVWSVQLGKALDSGLSFV